MKLPRRTLATIDIKNAANFKNNPGIVNQDSGDSEDSDASDSEEDSA
jgi:hypothetical protein